MVMQLENAIHHHCAEKPDLVNKFNKLNDEYGDLVNQNSKLRDRLIAKAGQYRDASDKCHGYEEQRKRAESCISELESRVKHLEGVLKLTKKSADKNRKYKDFFLMLRELSGVDISITTKTKEK
jgi:chromosome segregation ATPase